MEAKEIRICRPRQIKPVHTHNHLTILVVSKSDSMHQCHPSGVSKDEMAEKAIAELLESMKQSRYMAPNLSFARINYGGHIEVALLPTPLLRIAQMYVGQTYMVLVSDGQDDDQEKTKKVIDAIMHKSSIEFYSYFVDSLNNQNVNTIKRGAFGLIGGIPLSTPIVKALDWWVTRDVLCHAWYEHEGCYEQELDNVLVPNENENIALGLTENTNNTEVNEEDNMWNRCHTKEDYQCYLKSYPFGKFSFEARRIIKLFEVKANKQKGIYL